MFLLIKGEFDAGTNVPCIEEIHSFENVSEAIDKGKEMANRIGLGRFVCKKRRFCRAIKHWQQAQGYYFVTVTHSPFSIYEYKETFNLAT